MGPSPSPLPPSTSSFNRIYTSALSVLNYCGQIEQSTLFLNRVLEGVDEGGIKAPNTGTKRGWYNMVMSTAGKRKQYRVARKLVEDMDRRGVKPDIVTLNNLISAAGRNGEDAGRAFRGIKERGMRPDLVSYNTAMSSVSGNKDMWRDTFRYMDMIRLDPAVEVRRGEERRGEERRGEERRGAKRLDRSDNKSNVPPHNHD